jgi:tRNA(Ile)-lysidine synthase
MLPRQAMVKSGVVVERVAEFTSRHRMFLYGQRVGVAVSGGSDSVCLLHLLRELAPRWDLTLSVLHVDHGLRGEESRADAQFVGELAARLNLPFHCHAADAAGISEMNRDNLEQAAREIRRRFFLGFLRSGELDRIALGHTRSDQAETVLFRFLRGAGTAGLAGMRPVTREGFVRPMLDVTRSEVAAYLGDHGIDWREDSTNRDPSFARNRIRNELLPALARDWNPALSDILAGTATVARDEEEYWEGVVSRAVESNLVSTPPAVLFRAEWLQALPRALARRVARAAVERAKGDLRRIDLRHIEAVLHLAELKSGSGRVQIPGLDLFRSFDWVRLGPLEAGKERNFRLPLAVPGTCTVPGTRRVLCLELVEPAGEKNVQQVPGCSGYNERDINDLDWGRISGALELRNWRPGDQYRPIGHASETRIKSLFQDARIPLWERRNWPVLTCGEEILWSAQFGVAAGYAARSSGGLVLRIREILGTAESCNPTFGFRRPMERGSE